MRRPLEMSVAAEIETLTPLYDLCLVKRLTDAETTPSGLIALPATARNPEEGLRRGVVVAIGRGDKSNHHLVAMGYFRYPLHVRVGDEVLYPRSPANDVIINGEPYTFLHECGDGNAAIWAVIEKEAVAA